MASPTFYQSKIVNAEFGENVKIVEPVNIYGCRLGDNCFVITTADKFIQRQPCVL